MIPAEGAWTVALSRQHAAWGSFSYDAKEDATRFSATPRPAEFAERLGYRFEDPTDDAATLLLHWEKVELPIPIQVDTKAVTLASFHEQLRGLPRFGWQGWNQAANWSLRHDGNLDEALAWSDESLKIAENDQTLRVKAAILEKKGDAAGATALRDRAVKLATEVDMNARGYGLIGEKKVDEAIEVFKKNVKDYPGSWNVYDSLGEAYATKGDKKQALANYSKALEMAPASQKKRISDAMAKLSAR
jgi:tetratricopeptide (TPR) repeat protein